MKAKRAGSSLIAVLITSALSLSVCQLAFAGDKNAENAGKGEKSMPEKQGKEKSAPEKNTSKEIESRQKNLDGAVSKGPLGGYKEMMKELTDPNKP